MLRRFSGARHCTTAASAAPSHVESHQPGLRTANQQEVTVASDQDKQNSISRRDFTTRVGAATAGPAPGGQFFKVSAQTNGRVIGANDKVVVASIGIRGQGNGLKGGFARLKNVEVKTLCDVDANLAASRINDEELLSDVPAFKPGFVQDLRRVLDDKDVDAIIIA